MTDLDRVPEGIDTTVPVSRRPMAVRTDPREPETVPGRAEVTGLLVGCAQWRTGDAWDDARVSVGVGQKPATGGR